MTVRSYKRSDGKTYWMAEGYIGLDPKTGKQINKRIRGYKSKREAEKAFSQLEIDVTRLERITFQEAYEKWLNIYKRTVRPSTLSNTERIFDLHILPAIGGYYIDAIKLKDIQPLVTNWCDLYTSGKSFKTYMSKVFNDAMRHGYIKENPCSRLITHLKKEDNKDKKLFLEHEELKMFLEVAEKTDYQWYTFFRLLAYTGIRRGEALALEWEDLKNDVISINKGLQGTRQGTILGDPKTKGSIRDIDIDRTTLGILMTWRKKQISLYGVQPLMFCNTKKKHHTLTKPSHVLDRIFKQTDIEPISTHGFRHTHTAILAELGVDIGAIQKRLGHSEIATTMDIYHHVTKKVKEDLVKKLASY